MRERTYLLMAKVGDGVVDKVEARRFGHGVGEYLDVEAILGGTAAAIMIDSLRV